MDDILIHIPDKIVADDIKSYLTNKSETHLFSNIYKGKTYISPNRMIDYTDRQTIELYNGSFNMGYYFRVVYSVVKNKYIYYKNNTGEILEEYFSSENWLHFHSYVFKDLLDIFIWFNEK